MSSNRPVFYAPDGKRWKRIRFFGFVLIAANAALILLFCASLFVKPFLPALTLRQQTIVPQKVAAAEISIEQANADAPVPANALSQNLGRPTTVAFYVNWDDTSYSSLKRNISKIDWLAPEWIRLSDDAANPLVLDFDQKALDLIAKEKPEMPVLPLVQNYQNEQWNSQILARARAPPAPQSRRLEQTRTQSNGRRCGLKI